MLSAKLSRLPLRYFNTHKAGDIMSRVTNDLEKVSSVMQVGLMQLISLTLSITATAYVSTLAQRAYGDNMASMGALSAKVEEIYSGNRVVKLFNQQPRVLEAAEELNQWQWQFQAQRRAQFADYAIYPTIRLLGQLGFIATAVAKPLW